MSLVYIVKFPNNKVYVGITSRTLTYRKYEHLFRKREGSKRLLYNALRKYDGQEIWEELEKCDNYQLAKEREKHYIQQFKSNDKTYGYNLTNGGDGTVGYKFTDEQKERSSKAHQNLHARTVALDNLSKINNLGAFKQNTKAIKVTDLKTGTVSIHRSMMDLQKLGFDKGTISDCCLGKRKTHKQHTFEFIKE